MSSNEEEATVPEVREEGEGETSETLHEQEGTPDQQETSDANEAQGGEEGGDGAQQGGESPTATGEGEEGDEKKGEESDEKKDEKENDYVDWLKDPEALMGRRVIVLWARGKRYSGLVDEYDSVTKKHHVLYDDGEEKWYNMQTKTFSVEGEDDNEWTPQRCRYVLSGGKGKPPSGSYSYQPRQWKPYTSKTRDALTRIRFHLLMDPRGVRPDDRVFITGNLEAMGGWEHPVEMVQSPEDPLIYWVDLDMPYTMLDSCQQGMFQFRYEIHQSENEKGDRVIQEGQMVRVEPKLKIAFYHSFRANYRFDRFRGWTAASGKSVLQQYAHFILEFFGRNELTVQQTLKHFSCIASSTSGSQRSHAEDLFDDYLKRCEDTGEEISLPFLFVHLGMIGYFGVTSHEKIRSGGSGYSYTYINGVPTPVGGGGSVSYRKPPKPQPWCYFAIHNIDVGMVYAATLSKDIGVNYMWVVNGMTEAVERVSEAGSFEWLRIAPILTKYHVRPRLGKMKAKEQDNAFSEVANMIAGMVQEQLAIASVELAEMEEARRKKEEEEAQRKEQEEEEERQRRRDQQADDGESKGLLEAVDDLTIGEVTSISDALRMTEQRNNERYGDSSDQPYALELAGLAALGIDDEEDEKDKDPLSLQLARAWLSALVSYAPSISQLRALCDTDIANLAEDLIPAFVDKIKRVYWKTEDDFNVLEDIVSRLPALRCPQIASSIFSNDSADQLPLRVVHFVDLCISNRVEEILSNKREALAAQKEEKKGQDEAEDEVEVRIPLEEEWLELNTAAKEWLRRNHATEPEFEKKGGSSSSSSSGWYGWATSSSSSSSKGKKGKKPTAAEMAKLRRDYMRQGLFAVNSLFELPFFTMHPQGILFELSRCWFFKHEPVHVIEALCYIGNKEEGFDNYAILLRDFLSETSRSLISEVSHSHHTVSTTIENITTILQRTSTLAHTLLHALAVYVSFGSGTVGSNVYGFVGRCPNLVSILEREHMWARLFSWCPSSYLEGQLVPLLDQVRERLVQTATFILSEEVTLRDLHIVLTHDRAFLHIMNILDFGGMDISVIDNAKIALATFDNLLEQVQCYSSFFCSCGVRIDATALRAEVEQTRTSYDGMALGHIRTAFNGIPVRPHLDWLFALRSSELFLVLWRQVGREISVSKVEGASEMLGDDEEQLAGVSILFGTEDDEEEDQEGKGEDENKEEDESGASSLFAQQDQKQHLLTQVEDVILTQMEVCNELIPQAQERWQELCDTTFNGSISINTLEGTFGKLISEEQMVNELKTLGKTSSSPISNKKQEDAIEHLNDYLLLRKLCKWLPSLIRFHELISPLCTTPVEEDEFRGLLQASIDDIRSNWEIQTLTTITDLVIRIRDVFRAYSKEQLDFLATLGTCPQLVQWLLDHSSTEEFNRLTQVCRECTDDARLLSSIPSLKHVRTLLLQPLYTNPPYETFREFLETFRQVGLAGSGGESAMEHLLNIISSFDALVEVFEKQTRSPGIKSCYDLRDIRDRGTFIFRAGPDANTVLTVEVAPRDEDGRTKVESLEYLLDLRSKLLMAEIPEELEVELQANEMIEAFVAQLTILGEMGDVLVQLYSTGHLDFQEGYEKRIPFLLEGVDELQESHTSLVSQLAEWEATIKEARANYYFLNYFTMREILRMRELVMLDMIKEEKRLKHPNALSSESKNESKGKEDDDHDDHKKEDGSSQGKEAEEPEGGEKDNEEGEGDNEEGIGGATGEGSQSLQEIIEQAVIFMQSMGYEEEWCRIALRRCDNDVGSAIDFCTSHSLDKDRIIAEERELMEERGGGGGHHDGSGAPAAHIHVSEAEYQANFEVTLLTQMEAEAELISLLYLVASHVDEQLAKASLLEAWRGMLENGEPILQSLGECLYDIFGRTQDEAKARLQTRELPKPGENVLNRADMLVRVEDEVEKRLPVFVTSTEDPLQVIDTVLSVYIRRNRLPEPGELLFCTAETTIEDLELLIRRFISAQVAARGEFVFCIADLHNLSYTQQCTLVERLRTLSTLFGSDDSATLLMVSGLPRQVALNALSSQFVELPPLTPVDIRDSLEHAFRAVLGETEVIASTINGGGKSHHIMSSIAERQDIGEPLLYRRVPLRESTTSQKMVRMLKKAESIRLEPGQRIAYHLDIGHIVPAAANNMLFQLLVLGNLQDSSSCRVYNRYQDDIFIIEIPNSVNNKTALALRFCSLLPTTILDVSADTLSLRKPQFRDETGTVIVTPEYTELKVVCKWLRAVRNGKLQLGHPEYDADFSPWTDNDITTTECFDVLSQACHHPEGPSPHPSWSVMHSFVMFMHHQFTSLENYPLFQGGILAFTQGLENFKKVFIDLLIETSKDFSLRSVNQIHCVGPGAGASFITGDELISAQPSLAIDELPDIEQLPPLTGNTSSDGGLTRQRSGESAAVLEAIRQAGSTAPSRLVRQTSGEIVSRFQTMLSWEQSDHPVVVFKMDLFGTGEVGGVDVLSLNREFVSRYFDHHLKAALEANGIDFNKDWESLTNEQGVDILRSVEGLGSMMRGGAHALEGGYVLTVDNLLKMLSIQLRLKFQLPVIIMGETGCGKSTLIRNLCAILGMTLHTLNVHGGMEDEDILSWMRVRIDIARKMDPSNIMVVFLDEVNTCNSMGLFKELVCDRSMDGEIIPDNIKIIAACNPYRLRKAVGLYGSEEMAGLVFEHFHGEGEQMENVGTGIKDPLKNLVYRVHPLPESMIDHIFDFGALSSETESLYVKAMLRRQLGMYNPDETPDIPPELLEGGENGGEGLTEDEKILRMLAEMERGKGTSTSDYGSGDSYYDNPDDHDDYGYETHSPDSGIRVRESGSRTHPKDQRLLGFKRLTPFQEFVEVSTKLVCSAQECVRNLSGGERSAASLRDVARWVKVFLWFGEHLAITRGSEEKWDLSDFFSMKGRAQRSVRKAVILALSYCYHARLPRNERAVLVDTIVNTWRDLQSGPAPSTFTGFGITAGLMNAFRNSSIVPRCRWMNLDLASFNNILNETQREFTSEMNLGEGIALNEALCENLFMILISILNQIPIFVIGKPGSSKSLAMGLVQSNLNGDASDTDFLRSLPAVEVFSYQCSPLSTSGGIEQAFDAARRYLRDATNTVVVVLLDEVGLAEQSPHLPLKVLHKVLDEAGDGESVVGISNWSLDPAKMNRAVHLYRPAPTVEDLSMTAEGMVRSANLRGYLNAIARAYNTVYHSQDQGDFWGLREFYSTVRAINAMLNSRQANQSGLDLGAAALDSSMLLDAVLRNYGGRPTEIEKIITTFFNELGLPVLRDELESRRVEDLVRANIREPTARHLMLLTKNNAALGLLFDQDILLHERTEVIFGSDFPLDQTDLQVVLNIQQIKLCMAEGITVVLVHCESLYESLYDLLNQHYCEYGGQMYVRLAFGTHSRLCPIHRNFKVIVIVEKREAYTRLAPPLLNRFEKQVFERRDVLTQNHLRLLERLAGFVNTFTIPDQDGSSKKKRKNKKQSKKHAELETAEYESQTQSFSLSTITASLTQIRSVFCGYHSDLLGSLILAIEKVIRLREEEKIQRSQHVVETNLHHEEENEEENEEEENEDGKEGGEGKENSSTTNEGKEGSNEQEVVDIQQEEQEVEQEQEVDSIDDEDDESLDMESRIIRSAILRLLWICTPEATCRLLAAGKGTVMQTMASEFDVDIAHTYFTEQRHSSLPSFLDFVLPKKSWWCSPLGAELVVTTYSPLSQDANEIVQDMSQWTSTTHIVLHELDQERELKGKVNDFFEEAKDGDILLVQCDPLAASLRRIEHAKFLIESARSKYEASIYGSTNTSTNVISHVEEEKEGKKDDDEDDNEEEEGKESTLIIPSSSSDATSPTKKGSNMHKRGIHVIFLLHLPRGNEVSYCISFDTRWRFAFVDSVSPANLAGLPDVENMIGKSMKEVVLSLDLRKVLLKAFRTSLTRLVYLYERNNEDLRRQIQAILRCLDDDQFVTTVKGLMETMLSQSTFNLDIDSVAQHERDLQLAGTFQNALHAQILDTVAFMFAVSLSHMDRNSTLRLLLEEDLRPIWLYLFHLSFNELGVFNRVNASISSKNLKKKIRGKNNDDDDDDEEEEEDIARASHRRQNRFGDIEVSLDGKNASVFEAQYPFSFYVAQVLESLRGVTEGFGEESLLSQFEMLNLSVNIGSRQTPEHLVKRYCHDFCCMYLHPVRGMSRQKQAELLWRLLVIAGEERESLEDTDHEEVGGKEDDEGKEDHQAAAAAVGPISSLASIHYRFWDIQRPIELYFSLLSSIPSSQQPLSGFILEQLDEVLTETAHLRVLDEILTALEPENQKLETTNDFSTWVSIVDNSKTSITSLLDLCSVDLLNKTPETCQLLKDVTFKWVRISFFQSYVNLIAIPLLVEPNEFLAFVRDVREMSPYLDQRGTLQVIVHHLGEMNRGVLNQTRGIPDEFICPVTLEKMEDPVTISDGHTYERYAIEDWFERGNRTSPSTNMPLVDLTIRPNTYLKEKIDQVKDWDMSFFLEQFIFDIIFSKSPLLQCSSDYQWDPELLADLVVIASGETCDEQLNSRFFVGVLPSNAGRVGILRELCWMEGMTTNGQTVYEVVIEAIEQQLRRCAEQLGSLDTDLASYYGRVCEEKLQQENKDSFFVGMKEIGDILMEFESLDVDRSAPLVPFVQKIAKVRLFLSYFADQICVGMDVDSTETTSEERANARGMMEEMLTNISCLLATPDLPQEDLHNYSNPQVGSCRTMRVFLLKQIERQKGISFVRSVLMEEPLKSSPWVMDWKEDGESGFIRFLGSSKLPKANPLIAIQGFEEACQLVGQFLSAGDPASLKFGIEQMITRYSYGPHAETQGLAITKGAFLAALFHEVYLLRVLPDDIPTTMLRRCEDLKQFIQTTSALSFQNAVERDIYAFFSDVTTSSFNRQDDNGDESKTSGGLFSALTGGYRRKEQSKDEGKSDEDNEEEEDGDLVSKSTTSLISSVLYLDARSTPEALMRVRLMVHVLASTFGAPDNASPMMWFKNMLLTPARVKGNFFPTMQEDITKMAQNVMGGRWYACPNGHPFYVDLCGRPTVINKCAECGVDIGGTDHNLLDNNIDMGNTGSDLYQKTILEDKTERNYCVHPVETEKADKYYSTRTLNPTAIHIIRFILHSLLLIGSVTQATPDRQLSGYDRDILSFFNSSYANPRDVSRFMAEHVLFNWNSLKEMIDRSVDDVVLIMHNILLSLPPGPDAKFGDSTPYQATSGTTTTTSLDSMFGGSEEMGSSDLGMLSSSTDPFQSSSSSSSSSIVAGTLFPPCPTPPPDEEAPQPPQTATIFSTLSSVEDRGKFEEVFNFYHITRMLGATVNQDNMVENVVNMLTSEGEGDGDSQVFSAELKEGYNVNALPVSERKARIPSLFLFYHPFSLSHFQTTLTLLPDETKESLPILNYFIGEEEKLRSLQFLPSSFEFVRFMTKHLKRRFSREDAIGVSIGDILRELDEQTAVGQQAMARHRQLFLEFAELWNNEWHRVLRFGCHEVPEEYRGLQMTEETSVAFILPFNEGPGLCVHTLLTYLTDIHNNLVQMLDETLLLRGREGRRSGENNEHLVVSSRFFTNSQSIRYDMEGDFIPFLEKQCVLMGGSTTGSSRGVSYDFQKAQLRLIERYFSNIPVIDYEMQTYQFAHEQVQGGGIASLREKIPQEQIPLDIAKNIENDLTSPAEAAAVLDIVETAISFISSTGGSMVKTLDRQLGETLFSEYIRTVLLIQEDLLSRNISKNICLKHLASFLDLLNSLTSSDIFQKVAAIYKGELSAESRALLESAAPLLEIGLILPPFRAFLTSFCTDENMSPGFDLRDSLGQFESGDYYLYEEEFFDAFPNGVTLKEGVEAYKLLEELQDTK